MMYGIKNVLRGTQFTTGRIYCTVYSARREAYVVLTLHVSAYLNTRFDTVESADIRPRVIYDLQIPNRQPFDTPALHKLPARLWVGATKTSRVGVPKGRERPLERSQLKFIGTLAVDPSVPQ
jgi:hypothetical protein